MDNVTRGLDGPRAFTITDTDQGGVIVIIATILMSWMVLFFITRAYTRTDMNGPFGLDDLIIGVGTAFGVAHVGVLINAVALGLGKSKELLSSIGIEAAEKWLYISDILFLLSHSSAKLSVLFLLRRLGRESLFKLFCIMLGVVIAGWGVASTIAVSVKCSVSKPWLITNQCSNVRLRWQMITAFDVITECLLVGMVVYLVWDLRLLRKRKAVVVGAFGCRLLAASLSIVRLTYVDGITNAHNPTLTSVDTIICTEVLLHYSLMAATIPCLKPFVVAFNTGWGHGSQGKGSRYIHYSSGCSTNSKRPLSGSKPSERLSLGAPAFGEPVTHHNIAQALHDFEKDRGDNAAVSVSNEEPQGMTIRETRGWTVEHERLEFERSSAEK